MGINQHQNQHQHQYQGQHRNIYYHDHEDLNYMNFDDNSAARNLYGHQFDGIFGEVEAMISRLSSSEIEERLRHLGDSGFRGMVYVMLYYIFVYNVTLCCIILQ
jgi:hypothetical protein